MKKQLLTPLLAFLFFAVAMKSDAQWNLTGNANATATSILGTTNAIPLNLTTNNVQRLVIDANGKVGIGTSTPVNLLTVKGAGSTPAASWVASGAPLFVGFGENAVGNADYILALASTSNNARPVFVGRRSRGTLAAPSAMVNNDFIMSMLASAHDGTAFQNPATIDFLVDGTPTAGSVPARISFVTGSNSSNRAERLKIGNTGDISINGSQLFVQKSTGNVGVGTISPSAKLEVTGQVKISGGSPGIGKVLTSDGTGLASWTTLGSTPWNISGLNIFNTNDGNVGIGTASPTAKLDLLGTVKITDGTQGAGKVLTSDANGLASWATPGNSSPWQITGNDIANTNTGIVKVFKELNVVGLGVDSSNVFAVGNSDLSHKILMFGGRKTDPNPFIGWNSGDPLRFASLTNGFAERMRIDSNGKVGIGTGSPTALLSVNGGADKPGGGSWGAFSDARLKENVQEYTDGLEAIIRIKPVTYHYNGVSGFDTKPAYVGVIAQQLKEVAPYMVSQVTRSNDKQTYLQVDNSAMTYMLINAVKELSGKNDKLESSNQEMKKEMAELKAMMQQLINKSSAPCPPLAGQ